MPALLLGMVIATSAPASATTYNISDTTGAFTVVGSIVTDSATGVLSSGDILSWDLTLGPFGASLNPANSALLLVGNDLTATSTALKFNFSDNNWGELYFSAKNRRTLPSYT